MESEDIQAERQEPRLRVYLPTDFEEREGVRWFAIPFSIDAEFPQSHASRDFRFADLTANCVDGRAYCSSAAVNSGITAYDREPEPELHIDVVSSEDAFVDRVSKFGW